MGVYGGWTVKEAVSEEDKKVLKTALGGLEGCTFEPIAVAVQVVNGFNYIFIAKSTTITLEPKIGIVKIYVTTTAAGQEPRLVNIETII